MSNTNYPKPLAIDDVHTSLCKDYDSYERLPALLDVADDMADEDWLVLLGQLWSGFDNIGPCSGDLFWAIAERVPDMESAIPEMMNHEERVAFEALPEQITIYRGCGPKNIFGFSWSLGRKTAAKFPFIPRYRTDEPKLLTATISKSRAAALKLERGEQEVIVFDFHDEPSIRWTEEPLLTPC
ncbi:hypothetical protein [Tunturiibacter gelidoferens]|uniref:Uncharacterized protein n=1 Tax=Tunturiibacter lichenicola TaxID=2051959 RepID=A0A7Y9T4E4_9BACT|nr:hypothetical protein [Edaphobacter lichenicola]NYF53923.1 hypothetical protein [Edaphobacter lichenicola]